MEEKDQEAEGLLSKGEIVSEPSDKWSDYSNSSLSQKYVEKDQMRTSGSILTAANVAKLYVGIAFISTSKSVSQAGLYGSIVGFIYVVLINLYCTRLLIKTRNRFKKEKIVDVCDLTAVLFGEEYRIYMSIFLSVNNGLFLVCYAAFFGSQID